MEQQHLDKKHKKGYIALITVIVLTSALLTISVSLILLSLDTNKNVLATQQFSQAKAYADSCVEIAINKLKLANTYTGNETITYTNGYCTISTVSGSGNTNRGFVSTGVANGYTRKVSITISVINPTTTFSQWQDS